MSTRRDFAARYANWHYRHRWWVSAAALLGYLLILPSVNVFKGRGTWADIRMGYSTWVWGVLEEIQPTDIVNPLDISRFALDKADFVATRLKLYF